MGSRDSWLMASTLVAGCVFLGPEPVRADSTQLPSDSTNPRQTEQTEKCDAIYSTLASRLRQGVGAQRSVVRDVSIGRHCIPTLLRDNAGAPAASDSGLPIRRQSAETKSGGSRRSALRKRLHVDATRSPE